MIEDSDAFADIVSHDTYLTGVPHSTFARMRRDSPVAWVAEPSPGRGFWAVTRYADVVEVSRNTELYSCARGIRLEEMSEDELEARRTMMEYDPPEHSRLRRLVQPGFTRKVVQSYEEAFRRLTRLYLARLRGQRDFDFVTEFARELPIRMLCRLLGVPDQDSTRMVDWADQMIANTDPEFSRFVVDRDDTDEYRLLPFRSPAAREVFDYAERAANERRLHPRDDILSHLLSAEADGHPLTDLEFKNFFALLMVAGNETTRHTVSHGLWYLLRNPEALCRFVTDPSLSEPLSEEILRYSTVTMHFRRTATRDTTLSGTPIAAGDKVVLWFISANFDEAVFEAPNEFRPERSPNEHLAFGIGRHVCLGAWLARLEVRVTFEELREHLPKLSPLSEPDYLRSNFIRGIKHLRMGWKEP